MLGLLLLIVATRVSASLVPLGISTTVSIDARERSRAGINPRASEGAWSLSPKHFPSF